MWNKLQKQAGWKRKGGNIWRWQSVRAYSQLLIQKEFFPLNSSIISRNTTTPWWSNNGPNGKLRTEENLLGGGGGGSWVMLKCSHSCKYTQVLETAVGNSAGDKMCFSTVYQELQPIQLTVLLPWLALDKGINKSMLLVPYTYIRHALYIYIYTRISIGWRTSKIPIKSRESEITGRSSDLSPYGKPSYEQCRIWPGGSDFVS